MGAIQRRRMLYLDVSVHSVRKLRKERILLALESQPVSSICVACACIVLVA